MSLVVRLHTYTAGNVVLAQYHNVNENTLYNVINGNLNDANMKSGSSGLTEAGVYFLGTGGHTHSGIAGSGASKIVLSQDTSPDTYLMSVTATASGDAIVGSAAASGYSGIKGTGTSSGSFGGTFDNTSGGTSLQVHNTGNGYGAYIQGVASGTADHTIVLDHLGTAAGKAGLLVGNIADSACYGILCNNNEGLGLYVTRVGTIAQNNAVAITSDNTEPALKVTASADDGIKIINTTTGSNDYGLYVDMNGATGTAYGIRVDVASSGAARGLDMNCAGAGALGLDISTSYTTPADAANQMVNTGAGGALGLTANTASSYTFTCVNNHASQGVAGYFSGGVTDTGNTTGDDWVVQVNNTTGLATSNTFSVVGKTRLFGDFTVTGSSKGFVNPHPNDENKGIRFVTLEGPENGIYWRGRTVVGANLYAEIEVPEEVELCLEDGELLDVIATPSLLCRVAAHHDRKKGVIKITTDLHNVQVSVMCLGTRKYFKDFEVYTKEDWTAMRREDGSAAHRAYGPNPS